MTSYVVISGNFTSCKTPSEYVAHIVYGEPEIQTVLVGSHFVALLTYHGDEGWRMAAHTVDRMGSFPHAAVHHASLDAAKLDFANWVLQWAPRTAVVNAVV